jgi:enolase-phosphatase E1
MIGILLAALVPVANPVTAILTDIEGTTTSISFVHDTLFPYAKQNVQAYLIDHREDPEVQKISAEVQVLSNCSSDQVGSVLLQWMNQDKKITPLKTLQGMMWEDGYRQGAFQGHVYEDAYGQMIAWKNQGIPLYVYSSGSVFAQKLLYGFSDHGDMTPLFSNHFDTKTGGKREAASYSSIARQIGILPEQILFLSDTVEELNAAKQAGMQTILVCRDGNRIENPDHPTVIDFNEIQLP